MFGTYRLILAPFVLISHLNLLESYAHLGRFAVVNFYIVSGFVMSALVSRTDWRAFYRERFFRIAPQ